MLYEFTHSRHWYRFNFLFACILVAVSVWLTINGGMSWGELIFNVLILAAFCSPPFFEYRLTEEFESLNPDAGKRWSIRYLKWWEVLENPIGTLVCCLLVFDLWLSTPS